MVDNCYVCQTREDTQHMNFDKEYRIRICTDCLFMLANGENEDPTFCLARWRVNFDHNWPSADGWHVTLGWSEKDDGDDHGQGFSWSWCQGCGSSLGGDRFNATAWNDKRGNWDTNVDSQRNDRNGPTADH